MGYGGLRTYGYGLGYYGLGHRVYYGKREAEAAPKAEADPYLLYGGGYYGHLGYGHGYYYGKREAGATPKAEADPYLLYGGYGLGYGHLGYGYGLGYTGYYWG